MVNESLGQEWGDAVLRAAAQGLNATVRGGDTLACLEGDQFVVLCGNAEQSLVEGRLKGRIDGVIAEVNKELNLDGYTLTASIGVAWSTGSDVTAEDLLTAAPAPACSGPRGNERGHRSLTADTGAHPSRRRSTPCGRMG